MTTWTIWYCLRHDDGFVRKDGGIPHPEFEEGDGPYCLLHCRDHLELHGEVEVVNEEVNILDDEFLEYNYARLGGGWERRYWKSELCDTDGTYINDNALRDFFNDLE